VALKPPRLPYHEAVEERFGIDRAGWKALVRRSIATSTSWRSGPQPAVSAKRGVDVRRQLHEQW
jgi:hypothetical protein